MRNSWRLLRIIIARLETVFGRTSAFSNDFLTGPVEPRTDNYILTSKSTMHVEIHKVHPFPRHQPNHNDLTPNPSTRIDPSPTLPQLLHLIPIPSPIHPTARKPWPTPSKCASGSQTCSPTSPPRPPPPSAAPNTRSNTATWTKTSTPASSSNWSATT